MDNLTYFYVALKAHHEQHEFYLSAFRTAFIATYPPLPSYQQSSVYKDGGFRNGTLLADLQARFFLEHVLGREKQQCKPIYWKK